MTAYLVILGIWFVLMAYCGVVYVVVEIAGGMVER